MILCGGSQRFRAQVDRWSQGQGAGSSGPKPVLRVPLDGPEQLPAALSAVRFMYTGKLDVSDVASLLRVRRQAAYLQVEGGPEACEAALMELLTAPPATPQQHQQLQQQLPQQQPPQLPLPHHQQPQVGALAGVVQLYSCWDLVSGADMEPGVVRKLLDTCRQQLVKHAHSALGKGAGGALAGCGAVGPGGPGLLGELLAWAFGDAPSLLSDPGLRKQMEDLPAAALEALLGCDDFATDNEASVLLLVLTWLRANSCKAAARQRLFKLVRLSQLSDTYLLRLLPMLPSLGISPQELRFLQDYATAPDRKRAQLKQATKKRYDFKSAWYGTEPRPAPCWAAGSGSVYGRSYEWSVDASELRAGLEGLDEQDAMWVYGRFTVGNEPCVIANGIAWYPCIVYGSGKEAAGVYLSSKPPPVLRVDLGLEAPVLARPGVCRLVVYRWAGESEGGGCGGCQREEAWSKTYKPSDMCVVGSGLGSRKALALRAPHATGAAGGGPAGAGGTAEGSEGCPMAAPTAAGTVAAAGPLGDPLLARWAPFMKDGRLWGCLSWEAHP